MGVDVARFGDDKSVIYFRQGRCADVMPYERFSGMDTMQLAARVADWMERWRPDAVFVDDGGVGGGVVDRLHQLGFYTVKGVNFGGRSDYPRSGEKAANKRSEMWLSARHWLERGSLPVDEVLAAELTAPMYRFDANNAIMLERKEDMKKRGVPSPDVADAFALTFAYPVSPQNDADFDDEFNARGRSEATGY
jgi:hypothetical protein